MILNPYTEDTSLAARREEIDIKLGRIRSMLEAEGLEGVILLKHPNYSWITAGGKNYIANCFDKGEIAVLVTKDSQYAICSIIESTRARAEEQLEELGFKIIDFAWEENRTAQIASDIVGGFSKLGCDMALGEARDVNASLLPMRCQFTPNEMGRYGYLGDTLSRELEAMMPLLKPGMSEYEIAGLVSEAIMKHNIEPVMHIVSADERTYLYRHGTPTEKKLKSHLLLSINGRYKGLITTVSRMIHFGSISSELVKQYDDCVEMECRAIAAGKIGGDEADMYNTLKQAYVDLGYPTMFEKHGQGGCQGYWPREYMITEKNHHTIKANQCYCFNPVVDGTKAEDAFIVSEKGTFFVTRPFTFPKITKEINGVVMERPGLLVV